MKLVNIHKHFGLIACLAAATPAVAQEKALLFSDFASVQTQAEKSSSVFQVANHQRQIAQWNQQNAELDILKFRLPITAAAQNNTRLPVNFIPSEIFGGEPGTFREVNFGLQYVSNFTVAPQIDLLNLTAWEKARAAKIQATLVDVKSEIDKKTLFEALAATYYSVISYQKQAQILEKSKTVADSLFQTVSKKYAEGIIRSQDVTDARINQLSIQDQIEQVKFGYASQIAQLRILLDVPTSTPIFLEDVALEADFMTTDFVPNARYTVRQAEANYQLALSDLASLKKSYYPTVSLAFSHTGQSNSNQRFWDSNSIGFSTNFVGLRFNWQVPDWTKHISKKVAMLQTELAKTAWEHTNLQNEMQNKQTSIEKQKARAHWEKTRQIRELKESNFQKSKNQFDENILATDRLLTSFNDLVNSQLAEEVAKVTLYFKQTLIDINTTNNE
ncbi:MAG: TolC family protein [Spirosomataceae bacterium]